tara:strand:+ start:37 stop:738 length:702 start_codon:yes stop_codon:yes gene_type:complete
MDETKIITQYYDTDKNDNNFYSNINSKIIILLIAYIILISYKTYLNIVITSIKVIYDKITKLLSLFNNNNSNNNNTNTTINILTEEICEIQVSYNKLYNLYENLNKQYKTLQISHNRLEKYQEKNKELYITRKEVVNLLKDNITNTEDKIKNIRSEFGDVNLIFDILKIFMINTKYQISHTNIEEINEYLAVASDEDRNGYLKQLERVNNRIAEIYGITNDDFNKLYKKIIQK